MPALTPEPDDATVSPGETVIMQCLICVVLVVVLLSISMINIAPVATLRNNLRQTLEGPSTIGELAYEVRHFGREWLGIGISPDESPIIPTNIDILFPSENPSDTPYITETYRYPNLPPATSPEYYFPLTADEPSNPQIPGPSAVPGLWD